MKQSVQTAKFIQKTLQANKVTGKPQAKNAVIENLIHALCKSGGRLDNYMVEYAKQHGLNIWGSANHEEWRAAQPDVSHMRTAEEGWDHRAYQRRVAHFNRTGILLPE